MMGEAAPPFLVLIKNFMNYHFVYNAVISGGEERL